MSTIRHYPTAEIILHKPSQFNGYKWCWVLYLPEEPGQPSLASGSGYDREHAWQNALRARYLIQTTGHTI